MSETQAGQSSGGDAASGNTGGTPSPASPGTSEQDNAARKSAAESALERAKARQAAVPENPEPTPGEQAAAESGGESTREKGKGEGTQTDEGEKTTGAEPGETASDSTVKAPEDWSEERRVQFDSLPDDNARQVVLDIYKDFQGGFTKAMQQVAHIRDEHGALLTAMSEHGADSGRVQELLTIDAAFQKDAKSVLSELAKQAGVDIFFEPPASPGEIPQFETTEQMAEWMSKQTKAQVEATLKSEREESARRDAEKAAREALQRELTEAAQQVSDFDQHRPAVLEALARAPGLTVIEAFGLVTLPALREAAERGAKAEQELAALKAKQEREAKKVTEPPAGNKGTEVPVEESDLSAAERALRRAKAKKAKSQA